eukprot:187585_1
MAGRNDDDIIWGGQQRKHPQQMDHDHGPINDEQRGFLGQIHVERKHDIEPAQQYDDIAVVWSKFIICTVVTQSPLIIVVPTLQMMLVTHDGCRDMEMDTHVSADINITETVALFVVPVLWWAMIWMIIRTITQDTNRCFSFTNCECIVFKPEDECSTIVWRCGCLSVAAALWIGLLLATMAMTMHSYFVWHDGAIDCGSQELLRSFTEILSLIWLVHNAFVCFVVLCCILTNSSAQTCV